MAVNVEKFKGVLNSLSDALKGFGFEQKPDEAGNYVAVNDEEATAVFSGEKGAIKFRYAGERVELYSADDEDSLEQGAKRLVVSLLPEDATDKDTKYVVSEISETLNDRFSVKAPVPKKQAQKAAQTVSKAAVKNGSFYDASTLASKLCLVFPELREPYKANIAENGEFLGEKFFTEYGTQKVIDAINQNNPQTMKKMFQILNEIFEDGTNDTQSLIAVTILGELNNDQILLARCVDYMSETMAPPVIEVNKFFATSAGKKAKKKMLNPPPYKPKKVKKPGLFSQMMAGGAGMPPPTM